MWLLDLPGVRVSVKSNNANIVTDRNKMYGNKCQDYKREEKLHQRGIQAIKSAVKHKYVQTTMLNKETLGVQASSWDMYDAYENISKSISLTLKSQLQIIERLVMLNIYQKQISLYYTPSLVMGETVTPSVGKLWDYNCDIVNDYSVTSITWNRENPNLLAVGYNNKSKPGGLVACWSVKNPENPEHYWSVTSGVTCCAFNTGALLGVGCYDGKVSVYNIDNLLYTSTGTKDGHTGPVWEITWVDSNLLTVADDGKIIEWTFTKEMEPQRKYDNTKAQKEIAIVNILQLF